MERRDRLEAAVLDHRGEAPAALVVQPGSAREVCAQLARVLGVKPFCGQCDAKTWRSNGRHCVHRPGP